MGQTSYSTHDCTVQLLESNIKSDMERTVHLIKARVYCTTEGTALLFKEDQVQSKGLPYCVRRINS